MSAREPLFLKTSQLRDVDDLRRQSRADAIDQDLPAQQLAQFEAVTQAMTAALADEPTLQLDDQLSEAQRWAIEQLYISSTGRDPITTGQVSATDRSGRFNRALAILQPVLAVGLRPDFLHGRPVYAALTARVSSVRKEITRSVVVEDMLGRPRSDAKAADQDDGGGGGDGGDAGDTSDTGDAGDGTDDRDAESDHPGGHARRASADGEHRQDTGPAHVDA